MASKSTILSVDRIPDLVTRRCSRCRHARPIGAFSPRTDDPSRLHSWCDRCKSIYNHEYRHSERGKAKAREYWTRPEFRIRTKESRDRNAAKIKATRQAWEQTAMGRACLRRKSAKQRLKNATTPERRERAICAIETYTATIERLKAKARLETDAGLGPEPPNPGKRQGRSGGSRVAS